MAGTMTRLERQALAGALFVGLLGAAAPAFPQSKIGFVSLERILREAPVAQQAQKNIEQAFAQRGQDLSRQGDQLKKMQEDMEKNALTMSEADRQKRDREFGDANREFQRKQREFNEDLAERRKAEFVQVIEQANRAVRQIAEAEKIDVVFQNEQVVWASTRIDITDRVIKALAENRAGK
jgi:outer membrane protein